MKTDNDIILDLATDGSSLTRDQLVTIINNKLNGNLNHHITVLSHSKTDSIFPHSQSFVSNDTVDLLFKAKVRLDNDGVTDFILVTTLIMKKYWENLCLHMFSAVHNWSVKGIDVQGQVVKADIDKEREAKKRYQEYLTTVGNIKDLMILRSPVIPEEMFNAGFHERHGGVSQLAPLSSLNMLYTVRKTDPLLVVKENQRRLAITAGFDLESLHIAKVEHGVKIWVVGKDKPDNYDGVVTNIPGVTVAAPGADCCMILLADVKTGACGAVHSGWRGTRSGAVKACLKTMVNEFGTDAVNVHVAIGPSIEASCFTLSEKDAVQIKELDPDLVTPSESRKDLVHADLTGANVIMLVREGVLRNNIDTSHALCTVCNKQFFSYQRDSIPFGNQIGFISCRKK